MHPDASAAVDAELALLSPAVRNDRVAVDALLADGFTELGVSGTLWTRAALLDAIGGFDDASPLEAVDLDARMLGADVVLVTYITVRDGARAFRSSVWSRSSGAWRIEHHQASSLPRR